MNAFFRTLGWGWVGVAAVAIVAAGTIALQRQETALLRWEIGIRSGQARDLAALRAENARLRASQLSAAELETLRASYSALQQVRAEIETLKAKAR